MKPPEFYRGREQTYLKHLFLESYLEKVAYNIGSFADDFVYVDGFSGPWKSADEEYGDTSFVIALQKLRQVRDGLRNANRNMKIRCLFIEKNGDRFEELQREISKVSDITVKALHGEFETRLPDIIRFIGRSFSLIFIDPSGWTGFGLNEIKPLLQLRGEVLVNFMYGEINRHLEDPRSNIRETFDPTFGGPGWEEEIATLTEAGMPRESAVVEVYRRRFKSIGGFPHATTTRVLKPLADRTYFYLVYGTRHWKGLEEFRFVEKKIVDVQEDVRDAAKFEHRIERTGQSEMFGPETVVGTPRAYQNERLWQCEAAVARLREIISGSSATKYEEILADLLERPLVWKSDINLWIMDMRKNGEIDILGIKPREKTPKPGHIIVPIQQN